MVVCDLYVGHEWQTAHASDVMVPTWMPPYATIHTPSSRRIATSFFVPHLCTKKAIGPCIGCGVKNCADGEQCNGDPRDASTTCIAVPPCAEDKLSAGPCTKCGKKGNVCSPIEQCDGAKCIPLQKCSLDGAGPCACNKAVCGPEQRCSGTSLTAAKCAPAPECKNSGQLGPCTACDGKTCTKTQACVLVEGKQAVCKPLETCGDAKNGADPVEALRGPCMHCGGKDGVTCAAREYCVDNSCHAVPRCGIDGDMIGPCFCSKSHLCSSAQVCNKETHECDALPPCRGAKEGDNNNKEAGTANASVEEDGTDKKNTRTAATATASRGTADSPTGVVTTTCACGPGPKGVCRPGSQCINGKCRVVPQLDSFWPGSQRDAVAYFTVKPLPGAADMQEGGAASEVQIPLCPCAPTVKKEDVVAHADFLWRVGTGNKVAHAMELCECTRGLSADMTGLDATRLRNSEQATGLDPSATTSIIHAQLSQPTVPCHRFTSKALCEGNEGFRSECVWEKDVTSRTTDMYHCVRKKNAGEKTRHLRMSLTPLCARPFGSGLAGEVSNSDSALPTSMCARPNEDVTRGATATVQLRYTTGDPCANLREADCNALQACTWKVDKGTSECVSKCAEQNSVESCDAVQDAQCSWVPNERCVHSCSAFSNEGACSGEQGCTWSKTDGGKGGGTCARCEDLKDSSACDKAKGCKYEGDPGTDNGKCVADKDPTEESPDFACSFKPKDECKEPHCAWQVDKTIVPGCYPTARAEKTSRTIQLCECNQALLNAKNGPGGKPVYVEAIRSPVQVAAQGTTNNAKVPSLELDVPPANVPNPAPPQGGPGSRGHSQEPLPSTK